MKLLLDKGVPFRAAEFLRTAGHDCIHVSECGLETADDTVLLQKSREEARIVVTMDSDHHAILALTNATSPSVVRFRIEHLKGPEFSELLKSVIDCCSADLELGAMVTVQIGKIRVRRLPLVKSD